MLALVLVPQGTMCNTQTEYVKSPKMFSSFKDEACKIKVPAKYIF